MPGEFLPPKYKILYKDTLISKTRFSVKEILSGQDSFPSVKLSKRRSLNKVATGEHTNASIVLEIITSNFISTK